MYKIQDRPEENKAFPYLPDFASGRTNNGGFNLVENPEKIEDIHELKSLEHTKKIIAAINSPQGDLFTVGCDFGEGENGPGGYVEICFRDSLRCATLVEYQAILDSYWEWISNDKIVRAFSEDILKGLNVESSLLECPAFGIHRGFSLCLVFIADSFDSVERLLGYFFAFVLQDSSLFLPCQSSNG